MGERLEERLSDMPNGYEDHLQEQGIPRCGLFTEMESGVEIQLQNLNLKTVSHAHDILADRELKSFIH